MTADQTEVEPVLAGALELLREKPDTDLSTLAAKVAAAAEEPALASQVAEAFPALPRHTELTDAVRRALAQIPALFGSVEIETRRSLTKKELDLITLEESVIALIATTLKARDEAIRETMRVHMDVDAEEKGIAIPKAKLGPDGEVIVAATPRDQNGHYLLAVPQDPHQVPVGSVIWSQEYSSSAAKPSDSLLGELHRKGDIDRPDYLAVTREVRVFDKDRASALIRQHPGRGLALLRKITVSGKVTASLYLRKQS
jgi:hypothetical protein